MRSKTALTLAHQGKDVFDLDKTHLCETVPINNRKMRAPLSFLCTAQFLDIRSTRFEKGRRNAGNIAGSDEQLRFHEKPEAKCQ